MKTSFLSLLILFLFIMNSCQPTLKKGTFGYDLEFLQKHKNVIVLTSEDDQCQLVLVPAYQGRVMTSSAGAMEGKSYGWINYELIQSGNFEEHINVFGGEDRFWLGPEGGQYSIFFEEGVEFNLDNWFTPAPIDTETFELIKSDSKSALFQKQMKLKNYSGFEFDINVEREVAIFDKNEIENELDIDLGAVIKFVGYQSKNKIENNGKQAWSKETGLLSIWILGMFNPSESTDIIIPYKDSLELNTKYFGEVPADRIATTEKAVFFKGDGKYRCKIGLPPQNIIPVCGSYDADNHVLTIVEYSFSNEKDYVNSMWEIQDEPYGGDVVNSYNDGPVVDGNQLGPFYELESSSSARELKPGQSISHLHKTYHFEGSFEELNQISKKVLGVDLNNIQY